jgi:hypothetical protein
MVFADIIEDFADALLEEMGVDAIFTPASGPAIPLKVSFQEEILLQPGAMTAEVYAPTKTIEFFFQDIGRKPAEDETFTIGTTVYRVTSVLDSEDDFFCKCEVVG